MRKKPVHWEATHTFNPASVVRDGKIYLLYRAEDDNGKGIGGFTSRLGLAASDDGIHFTRLPAPVLYPDEDAQKENEWEGGCEDPRVVETEDGGYALFYTEFRRLPGQGQQDAPGHGDLQGPRALDKIGSGRRFRREGPARDAEQIGVAGLRGARRPGRRHKGSTASTGCTTGKG